MESLENERGDWMFALVVKAVCLMILAISILITIWVR